MFIVYFLLSISFSPKLCFKWRMLESIYRKNDFSIRKFVVPRLLNISLDLQEGIVL